MSPAHPKIKTRKIGTQDVSGSSVGQSRKALEALKKLMGRCKFKLVIKEGPPPTPTPTPRPTPRKKAVARAPQ